jgi:hypothetical protein
MAKQKGSNSAEAMAYKFIMHPKGKIDLPPDAVTFEGYQDFNRVEPYEVCIAGKPIKNGQHDYYEEARRHRDNLKNKWRKQGRSEKEIDTITINPVMKEEAEMNPDEISGRVGKNIPRIIKNMIRDYSTMDDNSFLQAHGMTRHQLDQRQTPKARSY